MKQLSSTLGVIQNLGWLDRLVRTGGGLAFVIFFLMMGDTTLPSWAVYTLIASSYPLMTGIIGYDPIYDQLSIRSCGISDRNPCGTFPFEVDAALGHHPIPDSETEHSLEHSHH